MRALDDASGPWVGWSIQDGRRIHERMNLRIGGGSISGGGEDADGDFEVDGDYDAAGEVAVVRRYTYCTAGPEGIGIPYLYRGHWDGAMISGTWKSIIGGFMGGPFEMWPEEATQEAAIELRHESIVAGA